MSKNKDTVFELEDISLKCEEMAALAFVTWDSFANGRFGVEPSGYEPVLRVLMDQAAQLKKEFSDILDRLHDKEKGGAAL